MLLIGDLSYVYERCRSVAEITPVQPVKVKGENYLLAILKRQYPFIKALSERYDAIRSIPDAVRDWIAYLDKRYEDEG